ncbi:MAG: hypothetical protein H3C62_05210 [Gemmatimonadaceae bacterium]|nr:hypothetical protein [Gemmatimonadaceae bacterium]
MTDSLIAPAPVVVHVDGVQLRRRLQPVLLTERLAHWQQPEQPILLDVRDGRLLVTTAHAQLTTSVPVAHDRATPARTVLASARDLDEWLRVLPDATRGSNTVAITCERTEWTLQLATDSGRTPSAYDRLYQVLHTRYASDGSAWPLVAAWAIAAHAAAAEIDDQPRLREVLLAAAESLNNREWDVFRPELRRHVLSAAPLWASLAPGEREVLAAAAVSRLEASTAFERADWDAFATLCLFERADGDVRDTPDPIRSRVAISAALGLGVPAAEGPTVLPSEQRRVQSLLSSSVLADVAAAGGSLPIERRAWAKALDADAASDLQAIARREVRDFSPGFSARLSSCAVAALVAALRQGAAEADLTPEQRACLGADDEVISTELLAARRWPVECAPLDPSERHAVLQVLAKRLQRAVPDGLSDARASGEARRVGNARTTRPSDPLSFLADASGAVPALGAAVPPARVAVPVTEVEHWALPASMHRQREATEFNLAGELPLLPPPALAFAALEAGVPLLIRPSSGEALAHTPALTALAALHGSPSETLVHFVSAPAHEVFAVPPAVALAVAARARHVGATRAYEEQTAEGKSYWIIEVGDLTWRLGVTELEAADRLRSAAWRQEVLQRAAVYESQLAAPEIGLGLHAESPVFAALRTVQMDRVPLEQEHLERGRMPAAELSTLSFGKGNYLGMGRERRRDPDVAVLAESLVRERDATHDRTLLVAPDALADACGLALLAGADQGPVRVRALANESGDLDLRAASEGRMVAMLIPSPDRYDATTQPVGPALHALVGNVAAQRA